MARIASTPTPSDVVADDTGRSTQQLQTFHDDVTTGLNDNLLGDRVQLPSFTVATLPDAGAAGGMIFVSDESGGAVPAFSDGFLWRRVTDRAVVS